MSFGKTYYLILVFLLLMLGLSACNSATDSSTDIEIFLTDTQERIISREVIPLNNCDGTATLMYERGYKVPPPENTLQIFSDGVSVEQLVEALNTSNSSASHSLQMNAPAGTKVEYTLAIYGRFRKGYAEIKGLTEPVYFEYIEEQRISLEAATQSACGQEVEVQVEHKNEPTKKRPIGVPITFSQPNCGGTTEVTNYVGKEHTISYSAEFGGQVSLSASGSVGIPTVGEVEVGVEIAAIYGKTYGAEETLVRGITLGAAPGTNMLHTYQLFEYFESGDIFILNDGKLIETYPYNFTTDFQIELLDSENLSCEGE